HQDNLTFSLIYAFSENFILPISHDEVVYGKGSLINKMPGSYEMKFQGMRGFIGYMMAHPGKKLMFMGSDIGQFDEWNSNEQLQWNLLDYDKHKQLNHYIATVNKFYRDVPAMHENDYDWNGFRWIALDDAPNSIISFRRIAFDGSEVVVVCNFQPVTRENYRIGVPKYGIYEEAINSESSEFGGCGIVNDGDIMAQDVPDHELDYSINVTLPPLGVIYFTLKEELPAPKKPVEEVEEDGEDVISEKTAEEKESETAEAEKVEEEPAKKAVKADEKKEAKASAKKTDKK
ncbi:MAG: alpha amylase C-terminal domain-containing protein, partial [Clostridia bacterium]|nr:alpha amylase C-terminal domain-containing protein [Clostridia bacterium]